MSADEQYQISASASSNASGSYPAATLPPSVVAAMTSPTRLYSSDVQQHRVLSQFIQSARDALSRGEPTAALSAVVSAVKIRHGDAAVFDALNAARVDFGLRPHANPLRNTQTDMALTDATSATTTTSSASIELMEDDTDTSGAAADDDNGLIVSNRVLEWAYADDDNVECPHCAALIPKRRYEAHISQWCTAIHGSSSDDT